MSVHVKLIDCTGSEMPCLLGHSAEDLLGALPEIAAPPVSQTQSPLVGKPIDEAALVDALGWLDANCPRPEWIKIIAGIHAAPIPDDPDGRKRREIAHRFSRGELDRLHAYDHECPERYTGLEAVDDAFDTLRPKAGGVTVGTILDAARKAGWRPTITGQSAQEIFSGFGMDHGPVPFHDVLTRTVAPVREIVPGLIEHGIPTFLSGPGGSQKSRLALQWGLSIDTGTPIFGRTVECATFVYVSAEDSADEVARRAQAIARRLHLASDVQGRFWDRTGKISALAVMHEGGAHELQPFYTDLRDRLRSIAGHKFVVLDSCYDFVQFAGKAKIDEGAVNAFVKTVLQELCTETDSTLLVLWHPSQAGQDRGDASGWSVAWHNAPRARLSIKPDNNNEDVFELRVEKRNHGPKGKPLTLLWSDGVLLPRNESATTEQETHLRRAVVRVAVMAAETGAPLTMQRHLLKWQLDEIERDIGRRPTQREVKEILAAALPAGDLRYIRGANNRAAGYYPPEMDRAEEMAREAKRRTKTVVGVTNGDENSYENQMKTPRKTTSKTI